MAVCTSHVVFFDTLCVFFSFVFSNFLFLKLQFMLIKMYVFRVAAYKLLALFFFFGITICRL